jgi:hypothetical protein
MPSHRWEGTYVLPRALFVEMGLVQQNAVKGERKNRRLGWINSSSIPISIPIASRYIGVRTKS